MLMALKSVMKKRWNDVQKAVKMHQDAPNLKN